MPSPSIFYAEGDGSQDDGTLFSLSGEFLEAAKVLQATPPVRIDYWAVIYYLLGHSAELALKAFLYEKGKTIKELRKMNHDLKKLASSAREAGLSEKVQLTQIIHLATTYKAKEFEYRIRKTASLPCLDLLTKEIKTLQSSVFGKAW